jgi:hypothetical protein
METLFHQVCHSIFCYDTEEVQLTEIVFSFSQVWLVTLFAALKKQLQPQQDIDVQNVGTKM